MKNLSNKNKSSTLKIILSFTIYAIVVSSCKNENNKTVNSENTAVPAIKVITEKPSNIDTPEGMVWIPGGTFMQGAIESDDMAMNHEKPSHKVAVDGFFMDKTEVTNAEFQQFVKETGYVTVAERKIDWEEMKKQLPPGTHKPHDSILQPGSLTFKKTKNSVPNLYDYSQWWNWTIGANWKHPEGPDSSIKGKENYPVVHIAFEDAQAYAQWAGKRLPTEAEWEYAARGAQPDAVFSWGNDLEKLSEMANSWEGEFPTANSKEDGFENIAPVKSYPPNPYGLYDMAGNVWEFTQDWYNINYYENQKNNGVVKNPKGASEWFNPNAMSPEKVIKGGSFLCSASYCASYRISARMGNSLDSSQEHLGFRTVSTPNMLEEKKH
ncbi:formylglycine-generating enzyme family protein [Gramella sp. AN32]|uniref:Formylglycine-generating enzyme family protein n=1 Tax=Christiangramia antarctica TaxID=2058158 RepID=A0ABW5X4M4_9FLAO|nr:formylglycine-generating enzyme family protein [Gramella sp. AN32]MCM4155800.1 formylglycine-generating enzyme family protein [Gramella sp. AN32]